MIPTPAHNPVAGSDPDDGTGNGAPDGRPHAADNLPEPADLRSLVNSVLWPGYLGSALPPWLRRELDRGLAGVVLFSQNIGEADERARLRADLLSFDLVPLVGIDEEGGTVTRVDAATGSPFHGAAQLGGIDDVALTEQVGAALAQRVAQVGANVVLAPVSDINTNPDNPVIGVRSFGDSAEVVSRHVVAMTHGIQQQGLAACAKHWPGHGDTHTDSHLELPRIRPGLLSESTMPFAAAIRAGVSMVMSAHIQVPEWGSAPATTNAEALAALRAGAGGSRPFEGVIVTDALDMAAISAAVGPGAGAVLALAAGADLLCIGNPANPRPDATADCDERDYLVVRDAVEAAVSSGELPLERVQEAAGRVATLRKSLSASGHGPFAIASGTGSFPQPASNSGDDQALRVDSDGSFAPAPHINASAPESPPTPREQNVPIADPRVLQAHDSCGVPTSAAELLPRYPDLVIDARPAPSYAVGERQRAVPAALRAPSQRSSAAPAPAPDAPEVIHHEDPGTLLPMIRSALVQASAEPGEGLAATADGPRPDPLLAIVVDSLTGDQAATVARIATGMPTSELVVVNVGYARPWEDLHRILPEPNGCPPVSSDQHHYSSENGRPSVALIQTNGSGLLAARSLEAVLNPTG